MSNLAVKCLNPERVEFSLFDPDEILKLSVVKVCVPVSFNALGVPSKNGLYDPAMGPLSQKSDACVTCSRPYSLCTGHFGHIELPLPVYNPLFLKTLYGIFRLTCLQCHTIQISGNLRNIYVAQFRLLEAGKVVDALELASHFNLLNSSKTNEKEEAAESVYSKDVINKYVSEVLMDPEMYSAEESKNIEVLRANFMSFAKEQFVPSKVCFNCKTPIPRINLVHNKLMTTVASGAEGEVISREPTFITPVEARNHLRTLWEKYSDFITAIAPVLKKFKKEYPTDMFFVEVIAVPPPKVRPINFIRDKLNEHPQTFVYQQVLEHSIVARQVAHIAGGGNVDDFGVESRQFYEGISGVTPTEKLHYAWQGLQSAMDHLFNAELNNSGKVQRGNATGLKQIISKKAGLIRMHMMGKRVNFAARTVITPDPNLGLDEIGIPEDFAKILTFPTPVTPWNVSALRDAVLNGPNVYPGANFVQMPTGLVTRVNANIETQRQSLAKRLLTSAESVNVRGDHKHSSATAGSPSVSLLPPQIVNRHLRSGDALLLNRQPTLHRPSIMAHRARVLRGERTFRLHYANCKAYNADFDGDEMNAHFPQNEVARSEAYHLAAVCKQYLVPKDGTPLSGLIQDHVVAGVHLTVRGRFFTRAEFCSLLHASLPRLDARARLLPPAVLKPQRLWSGKQLLSAVLLNCLPAGRPPPSLTDTAKISATAWKSAVNAPHRHCSRRWRAGGTPLIGVAMSEAEVVIRDGELLCGVLDKKHFGSTPYGLAHCLYELYGGESCMCFLSALGRLFSTFLQTEGFTLGVRDILVVKSADEERKKILENACHSGPAAIASALDINLSSASNEESPKQAHGLPSAAEIKLARIAAGDQRLRASVDRAYKQMLDPMTNAVSRTCLPAGLLEGFPANNLQLMVQSGAKGSTVNTLQISCLLGQIELEGRRPPLLPSGKALPSFCRFDPTPRAGGFVADRFLTGIRPQEFFFHCMAGREGLIDTAVKTSRSGYLQRCLVKHLEGLVVAYDGTVRDSDGSVVQFHYGEDSLEVTKSQFFRKTQLKILAENYKAFSNKKAVKYLREACDMEEIEKGRKEVRRWRRRQQRGHKKDRGSSGGDNPSKKRRCTPDPVASRVPPCAALEAIPEKLEDLLNSHSAMASGDVRDALLLRMSQARVDAGEPVGVLAAQSVGEPSTQMTLNTFHFAGRGDMNVTLGIPRLREVLMMASRNPKTPSMEVPVRADVGPIGADSLRRKLRRSLLNEILHDINVTESLDVGRERVRKYKIHMRLLPKDVTVYEHSVSPHQVLRHIEEKFLGEFFSVLRRLWRSNSTLLEMDESKGGRGASARRNPNDAEDELDPDTVAVDDAGGDGGEDGEGENRGRRSGADNASADSDSSDDEGRKDVDASQERYKARRGENWEYDEGEEEDEPGEKESDEGMEQDNHLEKGDISQEYMKGMPKKKSLGKNKIVTSDVAKRVNDVLNRYPLVSAYAFDDRHEQWCEATLSLPLRFPRVDLSTLLRSAAETSVVVEVSGVRRAFVDDSSPSAGLLLRTDGCNLTALFRHAEALHLEKLYSNDVYAMSQTYGIEAARAVLVREVRDVFRAYGIEVDPRHLFLVADYMTFVGSYEPLSRHGMEAASSPLQQMSFESSLGFLQAATVRGRYDELRSPSARLMLGRPVAVGTGVFGLMLAH